MFRPRPADERETRSGWRIALVGTGGQGVVTAARGLADAFVALGHDVVSGQLHGMAQRGGSVHSSVQIDSGISPVIARGAADFVLGLEPVETVRALPLMSCRTQVFMNTVPVIPFVLAQRQVRQQPHAEYPDVGLLLAHVRAAAGTVHAFDATALAVEAGSAKVLNVLMLGCLLATGALPCAPDRFWEAVSAVMPPSLVAANAKAFQAGIAVVRRLEVAGAKP